MGRRIDLEMKSKLVHMVLGKVRMRVCTEHSKSESAGTNELNEGAVPQRMALAVGVHSPSFAAPLFLPCLILPKFLSSLDPSFLIYKTR